MRKGRHEAAEEVFNQLVCFNPFYGYAYTQLGYLRKKKGMLDEANSFFNKAINYLPDNELGIYERGLVHVERRNFDVALNHFSKVLELNPSHIDALINVALVLGSIGDFEKAEKFITEAYEKDFEEKDGFSRLGWLKTQNRDWQGAFEIMVKDLDANRISPDWQINLAQIVGRKGGWEQSIELIDQAYKSNSGVKDGYSRIGWIKTENQDWVGAFEMMEKDVNLNRISSIWRMRRAQTFARMGELNNAFRAVEELYCFDKQINDGYTNVGWVYYITYNKQNILREAIERDSLLNRLSAEGKKRKAIALSILGDTLKAILYLDSLYSEYKFLKNGFAIMGWECIERGEQKIGLSLMEKDLRMRRLTSSWKINYAYQLVRAGQAKRAQMLFNDSMVLEDQRHKIQIGYQFCPLKKNIKNQFIQQIISIK